MKLIVYHSRADHNSTVRYGRRSQIDYLLLSHSSKASCEMNRESSDCAFDRGVVGFVNRLHLHHITLIPICEPRFQFSIPPFASPPTQNRPVSITVFHAFYPFAAEPITVLKLCVAVHRMCCLSRLSEISTASPLTTARTQPVGSRSRFLAARSKRQHAVLEPF